MVFYNLRNTFKQIKNYFILMKKIEKFKRRDNLINIHPTTSELEELI